ncbi:restriction endonuclease [Candidatus Thiomargarita nelsonii]|uniref:Restriction endonuclease n=1 Tax=Candidatus Thiomargarita nelsonii TaxID=1003181 RepID=A0A0A6RUL1_9GAMM|nr:restriction endonuclease [Candidatus Thiomargarita nelsonii]
MLDHLASRALVDGIINADSKTKGILGQRCAAHLGLEPGSSGKDGGIDGVGFINQQKIYFQSKLRNRPLNAEFADYLYSNLVRHKANIGIVLTGIGYTSGVRQRLREFDDIDKFKIHLLTLHDYFNETPDFQAALKDLPPLRDLGIEKW